MKLSLFLDQVRKWVICLCIEVLKCGPIPEHLAIIMDGNRRYARMHKMEVIDGHVKGFDKLKEVIEWCDQLGIREVTMYAFSIENFNRSPDEVGKLMELFREKCRELLAQQNRDIIAEKGARFRWIGDLSLLPTDLHELMNQITEATKDNKSVVVNMAVSYTGQEEITQAIRHVVSGVARGVLRPEDISEDLIAACLYTHPSPFPDLLIRTSGETRLSDFMLWQVSASYIHFTDVLWPDLGVWKMLRALFLYQRSYASLKKLREKVRAPTIEDPRLLKFLQTV